MKFNKKAEKIIESYGSIKVTSRLFYPRNFSLSDEFIQAFKREYARLRAYGIDDKRILGKLTKALHFHGRDANRDTV